MLEFLTTQARKNIWCSPNQDLQVIFKPARITPINGSIRKFELMWREYKLPTQTDRYHVYKIGQNHPLLHGLSGKREVWQRLSDVCSEESLIANLYVDNGLCFPLFDSWLWWGPEKSLVIAIKINDKIADLNTERLFMRLYSNAYFNSTRRPGGEQVYVEGLLVETDDQRLTLQRKFHDYQLLPGHAYCFLNGRLVKDIAPYNTKVGDVVEFIYDLSVDKVVDVTIDSMDTFDSTLDSLTKYLVHYPDDGRGYIEYHDDIDFWVIGTKGQGIVGTYMHRNAKDAVRMVTHRDYSIPTTVLSKFADSSVDADWDEPLELTLRLHIRKGGYERQMHFNHQRLQELYKLSDEDVRQAFVGVDSLIPEWRATNMEASHYSRVMESREWELDKDDVIGAYGYNAISKLVSPSPMDVTIEEPDYRFIDMPLGFQAKSHVYEHDANGKLVTFCKNQNDYRYNIHGENVTQVEVVSGLGGLDQGTVYGESSIELKPNAEYRFYRQPLTKFSLGTVNRFVASGADTRTTDFLAMTDDGRGKVFYDSALEHYFNIETNDDVSGFDDLSPSTALMYNVIKLIANSNKVNSGNKKVLFVGNSTGESGDYRMKGEEASGLALMPKVVTEVLGYSYEIKDLDDWDNNIDADFSEWDQYCCVIMFGLNASRDLTERSLEDLLKYRNEGNGIGLIAGFGDPYTGIEEVNEGPASRTSMVNQVAVNFGIYFNGTYPSTGTTVQDIESRLGEHPVFENMDPLDTFGGYAPTSEIVITEGSFAELDPSKWEDVTGSSDYSVDGSTATWNLDPDAWKVAVRSDAKHLAYSFDFSWGVGDLYKFTIVSEESHDGVVQRKPATIPPARLNLWMNGHSLIEGLDYFVNWPEVVVCNKSFMVDGVTQSFSVRAYGFCDDSMERSVPTEFGFIEHGLMSRNSKFDIRDDKNQRIIVNGLLTRKSDLEFSEDDDGVSVSTAPNGSPYLVENMVPTVYGLDPETTYSLKDKSEDLDKRLSEYLTLRLPEKDKPPISIIPNRYAVYSPFCSKVMHDLMNGIIRQDQLEGHYNDAKIHEILGPYKYLLDVDPTQAGLDSRYVSIHPHQFNTVVDLNIFQYTFFERSINLILDGQVNISTHVRIGDINNV